MCLKLQLISLSLPGKPEDKAALRGLFSDASADRVNGIIKDAIDKGASVGAGSWKEGDKGNVVQPLMLLGVTPAMRIYREELFSPVFSLLSYKTEEEAIQIANDHECEYFIFFPSSYSSKLLKFEIFTKSDEFNNF